MCVFEFFAGAPELGEAFFEMIGKQWHAEKISGRSLVMRARAASARSFVPVFDRAVAASKPSQGHEIDLLGPRQM
jgi:hypothetical protein